MKRTSAKKASAKTLPTDPLVLHDLPARLSELEVEIRQYPSRLPNERVLKTVQEPSERRLGKERLVQFVFGKTIYGAGHTDVSFSGANHARGVRHVRYYVGDQVVLDIEGDYEDQQLGFNFRFQNVIVFTPGEWIDDLVKLTDEFRKYKAKRKLAFYKKRNAAN